MARSPTRSRIRRLDAAVVTIVRSRSYLAGLQGRRIPGSVPEDIMKDTFQTRGTLTVGGRTYSIARLGVLQKKHPRIAKLPYALKILLENLLRTEDGEAVTARDIEAIVDWDPKHLPTKEI